MGLALRVLFTNTLAVNNNDGSNWEWSCDVLVCVKYAIWLVLSGTYHFWQMMHCSLQTKTNMKAVLLQGSRTWIAVVKYDTYWNLQRHRAVLPAIARLSCHKVFYTNPSINNEYNRVWSHQKVRSCSWSSLPGLLHTSWVSASERGEFTSSKKRPRPITSITLMIYGWSW